MDGRLNSMDRRTCPITALRDLLGMTGTKFECSIDQSGGFTLQINGEPVRSCMLAIGRNRWRDNDDRGDWRNGGGKRHPQFLAFA